MNIIDKLKQIVKINWTESDFGRSKLKAEYKKQLSNIWQLDSLSKVNHNKKEVYISSSEIKYIADKNGKEVNFLSARIKETNNGELKVFYDKTFPAFAKMVIDYLLGRYVFYDGKLYDVNNTQARLIDDITLF